MSPVQLFPEQASSIAPEVDHLLYFLLTVTTFFSVLIFTLILYFAVKYRRRSEIGAPSPVHGSIPLEITWTVIPAGLTMIMFVWGASLFMKMQLPPADALQIYA